MNNGLYTLGQSALVSLKLSIVIPYFQGLIPIFLAYFKRGKAVYPACVTEDPCKGVSIILGIFPIALRRSGHDYLTIRALSYQQMESEGCKQKLAFGSHI